MCSIINFNPVVPYSLNSLNFQKLYKILKFSPSLAELNLDIPKQINCIRFTLIPIRFLVNYIQKNIWKEELKFPDTNLLGKICYFLRQMVAFYDAQIFIMEVLVQLIYII